MSEQGQGGDTRRHRDTAVTIEGLAAEDISVVCPRCRGRALVVARSDESPYSVRWPRRLVCPGCGHCTPWAVRCSVWGQPVDPFFQSPLWLRASCCGGRTLWALNESHLDVMERHVAAGLRERPVGASVRMTLLARLPSWITSAKHRGEVLRTIGRLLASLDSPKGNSLGNG